MKRGSALKTYARLERRTPLRSKSRLESKTPLPRSWMRKGARKSKHARREREHGYMHFCHARGCELALDAETQRGLGISHDCSFERLEFAHLSDKKRYDVGDVGACLDVALHRGIDGNKIGGKPPWYVALGRAGQLSLRMHLANRARAAWDALSGLERATWEAKAVVYLELPRRSA